jgi:hypothetical protein
VRNLNHKAGREPQIVWTMLARLGWHDVIGDPGDLFLKRVELDDGQTGTIIALHDDDTATVELQCWGNGKPNHIEVAVSDLVEVGR